MIKKITVFLCIIAVFVTACKRDSINKAKVSASSINVKIDEYLKKAASEKDENQRSKLLAAASELMAEKGDIKNSYSTARRALKDNPMQKQALASVGEYYLYQKKFKEAQLVIGESLNVDKKYSRANYLMGNVAFSMGNTRDAVQYYKEAIKNDPDDIRSYNNIATVYLAIKDTKNALDILKQGIAKRPEFAQTYKNAGIVAEKAGKKDDAAEFYASYLKLNPNGEDKEVVSKWMEQCTVKK